MRSTSGSDECARCSCMYLSCTDGTGPDWEPLCKIQVEMKFVTLTRSVCWVTYWLKTIVQQNRPQISLFTFSTRTVGR